jgi:hypothetical protein
MLGTHPLQGPAVHLRDVTGVLQHGLFAALAGDDDLVYFGEGRNQFRLRSHRGLNLQKAADEYRIPPLSCIFSIQTINHAG